MAYTPVELRHVEVARRLLGYDRTAVQNLLTEIADSFETVWRERHELADHVESMQAEIQQLREREHALTQTLVAAEQAATHVKEQAKREAEIVIAEAHNEARSVTRNAHSERQRLLGETRRIEALLRAALGMVEESESAEPASVGEKPASWPGREDTLSGKEKVEPEAEAQQPQLRKVSGGFDWVS
ncbi:MAG TPA: DivIVA domain-containing protein [Gaiellaceae bacterium]|jgi:cell division initiation protein